jgi:hypothetical protein
MASSSLATSNIMIYYWTFNYGAAWKRERRMSSSDRIKSKIPKTLQKFFFSRIFSFISHLCAATYLLKCMYYAIIDIGAAIFVRRKIIQNKI